MAASLPNPLAKWEHKYRHSVRSTNGTTPFGFKLRNDRRPQQVLGDKRWRYDIEQLPVRHYLGDVPCLAKNNEGSMLLDRSMLTMRIERSICPRGASVRLPCLSKGACLQCVSRGASVRLQCLSKGACLQCVSRGASVRLQDGCSRLFWFAEDTGLFWKRSTCHSSGLSKRF